MNVTELIKISIILLLVATGVALLSRRLRVPYVTGLVLAGLPITELLSRPIGLDPALVLNLFLPILIFEAASIPMSAAYVVHLNQLPCWQGQGLYFPVLLSPSC